jgi:RNA polymerase sigma-70 factor (ECF subfamily)
MERSFEILAEQFRPMLLTYLTALVRNHSMAEDLTQETLAAAYRSLDTFSQEGNFGSWLRGIARNKVRESARAAMRRPLLVDSRIIEGMEEVYGIFDTPHANAGSWDERLDLIHECVGKLSGSLKQAVMLVYGQGHSLLEAAQVLNASFDALGQRLSRARVLIKKCVTLKMAHAKI